MRNWILLAVLAVPALAAGAEPEKVVVIEARIVRLLDKPYQELKLAETFQKNGTQILDADACEKLLASMMKRKDVETVATPKVTVDDNQTASIDLTRKYTFISGMTIVAEAHGGAQFVPKEETEQVGLKFQFTPRISTDGKFIRLRFDVSETTPSPVRQIPVTTQITPRFEGGSIGHPIPFTQFIEPGIFDTESIQQTIALAAGESVIVKLRCKPCERKVVSKVPMLGDIPLLEHLFTTVTVENDKQHSCVLLTAKLESAAKVVPAPPRTTAAVHANPVQLVRFNDAVPPPQMATIAPTAYCFPYTMPLPPVTAPSPIRFVVPPLGPVTAGCDQRLQTGVYELFLSATPASPTCPGDAFTSMCYGPALACQFAECTPSASNVVGFAAIGSVPQTIADGNTSRPQGVCGYSLMLPPACPGCVEVKVEELKPVKCWPQVAPVAGPPRTPPLPVPSTPAKTILCDGKATLQDMDGKMMLTADRVEIRTAGMATNPVILKILLEQYNAASKAGDVEKARTIAAYCLEMDPTCFAKR